jgi:hypothetical protein
MHQLKSQTLVTDRKRRFNRTWPPHEDKNRSCDPKIVFEEPKETLRFYMKGDKGGVQGLCDWWSQQSWSGRWSGSVLGSYHPEGVIWILFEGIILARVIVLTGRVQALGGSCSLS